MGIPPFGVGLGGSRSSGSRRRPRERLGCPQQPLNVIVDSLLGHRSSEPAFDDRDRPRYGEPNQHRPPAEVVDDQNSDSGDPEPETVKAADEPPQAERHEAPPQAVEDSEWTALVRDERRYPPDRKSGEHEEERLGRL